MISAIKTKNDIVHSRTRSVEDTFVYHVNDDCYNRYVYLKTKASLYTSASTFVDSSKKKESPLVLRTTRLLNTAKSVLGLNLDKYDTICAFCGKICKENLWKV